MYLETSIKSAIEASTSFKVVTFTGHRAGAGLLKYAQDLAPIGDVLVRVEDLDAIIAALQAAREALSNGTEK